MHTCVRGRRDFDRGPDVGVLFFVGARGGQNREEEEHQLHEQALRAIAELPTYLHLSIVIWGACVCVWWAASGARGKKDGCSLLTPARESWAHTHTCYSTKKIEVTWDSPCLSLRRGTCELGHRRRKSAPSAAIINNSAVSSK